MYYSNCVCTTIECNDEIEIRRFKNYSNWHNLSTDEKQKLFVLCYTLSRDMFDNNVFFQSDALCMEIANEFYEISQVSSQLVAARSIAIAGRTHRFSKKKRSSRCIISTLLYYILCSASNISSNQCINS